MIYLSEEEQYKRDLSIGDIQKIQDFRLRKIRQSYFYQRHEAHMNEHGIPDCKIGEIWKKIKNEEMKAIEEYKNSRE